METLWTEIEAARGSGVAVELVDPDRPPHPTIIEMCRKGRITGRTDSWLLRIWR